MESDLMGGAVGDSESDEELNTREKTLDSVTPDSREEFDFYLSVCRLRAPCTARRARGLSARPGVGAATEVRVRFGLRALPPVPEEAAAADVQ